MYWERHNVIYYSSQTLKLLFNQEKQSDKSKVKDILPKNYSALFQMSVSLFSEMQPKYVKVKFIMSVNYSSDSGKK